MEELMEEEMTLEKFFDAEIDDDIIGFDYGRDVLKDCIYEAS